jgi:hypothetical protein
MLKILRKKTGIAVSVAKRHPRLSTQRVLILIILASDMKIRVRPNGFPSVLSVVVEMRIFDLLESE